MLAKWLMAKKFKFPYQDFDFPGRHSQEQILFVTRESEKILLLRLISVFLASFFIFIFGLYALTIIKNNLGVSQSLITRAIFYLALFSFFLLALAGWWFIVLWRQSVFIITNRRLTKIIYTSPWNKYHLSLNLDKIVDGGAYKKGIIQPLLGLGYFVARSSAGNIKNFKIVNIDFAEDLHNYVTKLLYAFSNNHNLDNFRPFIPYLKGPARRRLAPEYYRENS